jgi:hypothetical protein
VKEKDKSMSTREEIAPERRRDIWVRGAIMLLFILAAGMAQAVVNALAVVQFVWSLITGEPNRFLARFGGSLAKWAADVVRFLSCASEEKPFPWKEWPSAE